jgi:putative SOS response-associated peptidase YedK
MVVENWKSFLRDTQVKLSIHDFHRLYVLRNERGEAEFKIPRGYVREFSGDTPEEQAIRDADATFRRLKIADIEATIFEQRKRIADAERKLAVKATKTAAESKRIGEGKVEKCLSDLAALKDTSRHRYDYRAYPSGYVPVIIRRAGELLMIPARYRCRPPGKPAFIDKQLDLYNARRDGLTERATWRPLFGTSHAILPATRFYENVRDAENKNHVLEFVPKDGSVMLIACLYAEWVNPADPDDVLPSVAAITDEPAPEVAAAGHDRTVINLTWEAAINWLSPEGRSPEELQALLDQRQRPYYEHREAA